MSHAFVPFGPSHLAVIALTVLLPLALAAVARRSTRLLPIFRLAFAAQLIATWGLWYWLIVASGWVSPETVLPMQLCDWAGFAAIATLLRPGQSCFELAYFWSLSGTLQALLTPELFYDFPDLRFIVFFAFHGGVIASVIYLLAALRMRPGVASLLRVAIWSLFYLGVALSVNALFHTNFGYLRAKPASHSMLDLMPPWPWYILELVALGVVYIIVLYAPFFVFDILRDRARSPAKKITRSRGGRGAAAKNSTMRP